MQKLKTFMTRFIMWHCALTHQILTRFLNHLYYKNTGGTLDSAETEPASKVDVIGSICKSVSGPVREIRLPNVHTSGVLMSASVPEIDQ